MKIVFWLLLLFSFLLLPAGLSATWVREKGRALIYTDLSYRTTDTYYTGGQKMKANDFYEASLNLYADYGVTDRYTIGAYLPVIKSLSLGVTGTQPAVIYTNIGDMELIQRLQILEGLGAVFNLELLIGIPTGYSEQRERLHTGDGEFNFRPGASLGWGFPIFSLPSYLTLSAGLNLRTRGFSDEVHSAFQWGLFVYEKSLLLSIEVKSQKSQKTNDETFTDNGLWNNTSYVVYSPGITWKFNEDSGISFYYKTLREVENSLAGDTYSLALFTIF